MAQDVSMKFISTSFPCAALACDQEGLNILYGDSKEPYIFTELDGQTEKKFATLNGVLAYAVKYEKRGRLHIGNEFVGNIFYCPNDEQGRLIYDKAMRRYAFVISPVISIISRNLALALAGKDRDGDSG